PPPPLFPRPVPRGGGGDGGAEQRAGRGHDVPHGAIERRLVRFRRLGEAAQLPHELQGGRANLRVRGRRSEVVQGLDVSTHGSACWLPSDLGALRQGVGETGCYVRATPWSEENLAPPCRSGLPSSNEVVCRFVGPASCP